MTGAVTNFGGENENGALETTVSAEDAGRENEKEGLDAPKEKLGAVAVEAAELGVTIEDIKPRPVVDEGVVVDILKAGVETAADVTAGAEMTGVTT